jgi:hypothetical protein
MLTMFDIVKKYFNYKDKLDIVGLHKELKEIGSERAESICKVIESVLMMEDDCNIDTNDLDFFVKKFIWMFRQSKPADHAIVTPDDLSVGIVLLENSMSVDEVCYRMLTNLLVLNVYDDFKKYKVFECIMNYWEFRSKGGMEDINYFNRLVEILTK